MGKRREMRRVAGKFLKMKLNHGVKILEIDGVLNVLLARNRQ